MAADPALQPDCLGLSPYLCGHVIYLFQKPAPERDSLAVLVNYSHREFQAQTQPQVSECFQTSRRDKRNEGTFLGFLSQPESPLCFFFLVCKRGVNNDNNGSKKSNPAQSCFEV